MRCCGLMHWTVGSLQRREPNIQIPHFPKQTPWNCGIFLARSPRRQEKFSTWGSVWWPGRHAYSLPHWPCSADWLPDTHPCAGPGPWLHLPGAESRGPAGMPLRQLHQEGADRMCTRCHREGEWDMEETAQSLGCGGLDPCTHANLGNKG